MSLFMTCKEFSSKTASGQLGANASAYQRLKGALHLSICAHCRCFARNNATLDEALQSWRQHLQASNGQDHAAEAILPAESGSPIGRPGTNPGHHPDQEPDATPGSGQQKP